MIVKTKEGINSLTQTNGTTISINKETFDTEDVIKNAKFGYLSEGYKELFSDQYGVILFKENTSQEITIEPSPLIKIKTKAIKSYIHERRCHYIKFPFISNPNWSIRYFYVFTDRPQYEKRWVLKKHKDKSEPIYLLINSESEAFEMTREFTSTYPEEILGRFISDNYEKVNLTKDFQ